MRRPLFAALAAIAAAVWITIMLFPWKPTDYEPYRNDQLCLTGTVRSLEPKREGEDVVWRMMLSDIAAEPGGSVSAEDAGKKDLYGKSAISPVAEPGEKTPSAEPAAATAAAIGKGKFSAGLPQGFPQGKEARVLCVLDREPAVDLSARVRIRGTMIPFRPAYNEGEFDLRLYYHILRVEFSLRSTEILAASKPSDPLAASLYHCKKYISNQIDRIFSTRNSPVLQAMLLGEKGLLEEETKELYQGAGIIHILSISGLHLSLLGMSLFSLLEKLRVPLKPRSAASLVLILLYGKMIGLGTSPFRALVMMSLYIGSRLAGRTYDLLTACGIACILLLFDQPLYLLHTGFQFSFAAVLSLGILAPALPGGPKKQEKGSRSKHEKLSLKDRIMPGGFLQAVAVPAGTFPVYLWAYGTFPVWSLLLNLLVIPLMPLLMGFAGFAVLAGIPSGSAEIMGTGIMGAGNVRMGIVEAGTMETGKMRTGIMGPGIMETGIIGKASAFLARLAAFPAEKILDFYRLLAQSSGSLPGHRLILGRPSPLQTTVYIGMLLLLSAVSVHLQMPHVRRRIEAPSMPAGSTGRIPLAASHRLCSPTLYLHDLRSILPSKSGGSGRKAGTDFLADCARNLCRLFRLRDNRARRRFGKVCVLLWLTAAVLILTLRRPPSFSIDVLYVGQGDGICIRSGETTFLIDGGSTTKDQLADYTLLPYFYSKGIRKIDCAMLTHDDRDHCSGLLEILEETVEGDPPVRIGQILLPDIADAAKGENYRRIEFLAAQAKIPVSYAGRGLRIRAGQVTMDCLHPAQGAAYPDANAYSMTLLLRKKIREQAHNQTQKQIQKQTGGENKVKMRKMMQDREFTVLLTGDLEEEGEKDLLAYLDEPGNASFFGMKKEIGNENESGNEIKTGNENVNVYKNENSNRKEDKNEILQLDVLKVAHHGSRGATSAEFLQHVQADTALISAGINNTYGHPHAELLQRLSDCGMRVLRTDESGEISVREERGKMVIRSFFQGK